MTQDYKEKYPIGSKWENGLGSLCILVQHDVDDEFMLAYSQGSRHTQMFNVMGRHLNNSMHDLIKPWVEKESVTDEIALFRSKGGSLGVLSSNVVDGYNDVTILARKTITIVEGEGMDNVL